MRRSVVAVLFGLVAACGNSSGTTGDANGGDDDQTGDDAGGTSGPRTVKLTLTNRPMTAANFSFLVAYQDGSAAWQLAPAPAGDVYSFEINAPNYGVAFACIGTTAGTTTQVRSVTSAYFAVGERTELTLDVPARCSDRQTTMGAVMLNGSVTNRPFNGGTLVAVWGGRSAFVGTQTGNFQLTVQPGTHDLFVVHAVPEGNGDFYTDEVWVARDVTLTANTNRTINFNEAQSTTQYAVNIGTVDPAARVTASTTVYTANGTAAGLVRETMNWETSSLADAQMKTTDVYDQSIQVSSFAKSATVTHATNEPGDIDWTAPAPLGAVQSMTATKMPYVILQATWPAYADVDGYLWNAAQQLSGSQCGGNTSSACSIVWQAYLSPGVTGAMPAFRMPELADLAGWKDAFELVSGTQAFGSVTAYTSSAGAGDFPAGVPANGTTRTFVRSDFATTP
ncbi:MAG TPA: hypothetical protein VMZ53_22915 [Kofleriaceae bacterium]|nr:hypothetical protein [Kofleriaceae bacterium]